MCGCNAWTVFRLGKLRGSLSVQKMWISSHRGGRFLQKAALKEDTLLEGDEPIGAHKQTPGTSKIKLEAPFIYYRPTDFVYKIQKRRREQTAEEPFTRKLQWNEALEPPQEPVSVADFKLLGTIDPEITEWKQRKISLKEIYGLYANLAKSRLTALVTTTAVTGYLIAPEPVFMGSLALCALGTGLLSASANSVNQFLEIPYDCQMKRTQARVLVRGALTPLHAACFATACGTLGFSLLLTEVNGLTAFLGLANAVLYFGVYTPMKRYHIGCTWVGAVVGAIPPLMGWAANCNSLGVGALTLAGILYAWQFPHFNGLSWNLRPDYSRAGYRVMCVTNPGLCRRTTLRYSIALLGLCSVAAPLTELTHWTFAVDSIPLNLYLIFLSYKFYRTPDSQTSRKLFRYTLIYLPALMMLMLISKHFNSVPKRKKLNTGVIEDSDKLAT